MPMQLSLLTKGDGTQDITVFIPERDLVKTARSDYGLFKEIKRLAFKYQMILDGNGEPARDLTDGELDELVVLFNKEKAVNHAFERLSDRYTVREGALYKDAVRMTENDPWATQVMRFVNEGSMDWGPLIRFRDKLDANPNEHSREQFYQWLRTNPFAITEDGDVVAYKGVARRYNGDDIEDYPYESTRGGPNTIVDDVEQPNGRVKQGVGSVVEHPRNLVHFDPNAACSNGLHCGTYSYASSFGKVRLRVLINPRDVVNVPNHDQKVRVCRYVVLDEAEHGEYTEALLVQQRRIEGEKSIASVEKVPGENGYVYEGEEGDGETVQIVTPSEMGLADADPNVADTDVENDPYYCYGCKYSHDGSCEDPTDAPAPEAPSEPVVTERAYEYHRDDEPDGQGEFDAKPARPRYPAPKAWDEAVTAAKRRKKGVKGFLAITEQNGWVLRPLDPEVGYGEAVYNRKAWRVLTKAEREAQEA